LSNRRGSRWSSIGEQPCVTDHSEIERPRSIKKRGLDGGKHCLQSEYSSSY
jgi:hypothetical protein